MNETYRIIISRKGDSKFYKNINDRELYLAEIQERNEEYEWKTIKYVTNKYWKICMSRAVKKLDKAIEERKYEELSYEWHKKWKEENDKYRLK